MTQGPTPPILGPQINAALQDFQRARMQAALQEISARLHGNSPALLAFNQVAHQLRMTGSTARGLQTIMVKNIVGSVGRYADFSYTFLPRQASSRERWAAVRAARHVTQLPPIHVYQIGEVYFVLDGNHRVSVARREGLDYLEAYVIEVKTRVPLTSADSPDSLIIKSEYAAFLEQTRLDTLRPGANLLTSVPGQYAHLENLIEVYRYLVEEAEERPLSDAEAVGRWYDEAYLPLVEVAREFGILNFFPGRTEADFYVWVAAHQIALQQELGWAIRPETAVTQLAEQLRQQQKRPWRRLARRVYDALRQQSAPSELVAQEQWETARLIARYSDRLFQDIMTPVRAADDPLLIQALRLAGREAAQLCGLLVGTAPENDQAWVARVQEAFEERCREANVRGYLAVEVGDLFANVIARASLTDLVMLDRAWLLDAGGVLTADAVTLLTALKRPVLITPAQAEPFQRPLLAYDGRPRADEALFITAYLGERWGFSPVVVTVLESRRTQAKTLDRARRYLEMHEVAGVFVTASGPAAGAIQATAVAHNADCIIIGRHGSPKKRNHAPGQTARRLLLEWERPLFICP